MCVYRAVDGQGRIRPALATSYDGISWQKRGTLIIDVHDHLAFLSGTLFAGTNGLVLIGLETSQEGCPTDGRGHLHGGDPPPNFVAYDLDYRRMNLATIFRAPWESGSPYEYQEHPLLGYTSLVYDPLQRRVLTYVQAIGNDSSGGIGLNDTVERLLLYETPLRPITEGWVRSP